MSGSDNLQHDESHVPPACAVLGATMVVQSINRGWRELTGYLPQAVVGLPFTMFFEDPSKLGLRISIKADPTRINALPVSLRRNPAEFSDDFVPVSLTMHPLYDQEDAEPSGYLAVVTPVPSGTQMPNLGGVWLEPNEFVGHLVRGTAHKLNNLVTVFQGYTDMLLVGGPEDEELREALAQMNSASNGLVEIINRLLEVGGRASLDCREVEAWELCENLQRLTEKDRAGRIKFEVVQDPDLPKIIADPKRLEQSIAELVRNACDSMPQEGKVEVHFSKDEEGALVITVSDTGPGLDANQQRLIFRPYFTTKKNLGRLGIGINAVSGVVGQMGGELQVRSQPGKGSQFRIVMPSATASVTGRA